MELVWGREREKHSQTSLTEPYLLAAQKERALALVSVPSLQHVYTWNSRNDNVHVHVCCV